MTARLDELLVTAAVEALGEDAGLGSITAWVNLHKAAPSLYRALHSFTYSRPGYPAFVEYYHDESACEGAENCAHCLAMSQARAAIDEATTY